MTEEINDETLDLLEKRINKLENAVYGKNHEVILDNNIISTLAEVGGKLGNAITNRDRIMMVFNKVDELEECLSPSFLENCELNDELHLDSLIKEAQQQVAQVTEWDQHLQEVSRGHQDHPQALLDADVTAAALCDLKSELQQRQIKQDALEGSWTVQKDHYKSLVLKQVEITESLNETLEKLTRAVDSLEGGGQRF